MSKERLNELWNKVKHIGTIDQFDDERMMALGSVFGEMRAEIEELEQQNSRYRELLESIRYTQDVAKEIQAENPNIKVITPDDLLQHMLRKVNKELESELNA